MDRSDVFGATVQGFPDSINEVGEDIALGTNGGEAGRNWFLRRVITLMVDMLGRDMRQRKANRITAFR